ncbi:MAG: PIN domain-containing protein [Chloroherpetonaceae bacterium]|nr:PIN domain-containing protein [Chloroherpetonaceae bacterium]MDW8438361.1 PIN domain-containing protein [Chloroherpetonaceae bacterium]
MRLLIDTNIFLELLLGQEKQEQAKRFLLNQPKGTLCVSEFSLNSAGIKLFRAKRKSLLLELYQDLERNKVERISLTPDDVAEFIDNSERWGLDFDDAYQYTVAKKRGLSIVSFDADFDKTDLVRIEPK